MNILDHIPSAMKKTASTGGGEWHGPCPFCGGKDRFVAWPKEDRAWCRQCDWSGDAIQLLRDNDGLSFAEAAERTGHEVDGFMKKRSSQPHAPEPCRAPSEPWQARARLHGERCVEALWSTSGQRPLDYLRRRGFGDRTIRAASFGYNPSDVFDDPRQWGFDGGKKIFLPRGITIPWVIDRDTIWNLRVRRPLAKESCESRYLSPRGCGNGLYLANFIRPGLPVLLCEGELDAWSAAQEAEGLIIPVATGSTHGARRLRWSIRMGLASCVLVAYDSDDAGEEASRIWLADLPNARRWRPYWGDLNQMLCEGADLREWVEAGLGPHLHQEAEQQHDYQSTP